MTHGIHLAVLLGLPANVVLMNAVPLPGYPEQFLFVLIFVKLFNFHLAGLDVVTVFVSCINFLAVLG